MADWTDPPYSALTVDKAWTDEKATAAFENVVALAEGAPGAPKVQGVALGGVYIGYASASGSPLAVTDLDRVKILHMDIVVGASTGWNFQVRFSNNNGATWGSYQNVGPTSNAAGAMFSVRVVVDLTTGNTSYVGFTASTYTSAAATLTVPADCNAISMTATGSAPHVNGLFTVLGGVA